MDQFDSPLDGLRYVDYDAHPVLIFERHRPVWGRGAPHILHLNACIASCVLLGSFVLHFLPSTSPHKLTPNNTNSLSKRVRWFPHQLPPSDPPMAELPRHANRSMARFHFSRVLAGNASLLHSHGLDLQRPT
jgi:hypothetical protein